eukprot:Gb_37447 [translate_table: standard]
MSRVSVLGFFCLLCILNILQLNEGATRRLAAGNTAIKDLAISNGQATVITSAEHTRHSEMEGMGSIKDGVGQNGSDEKDLQIDGRELMIYHTDYHGPTTHPPSPDTPRRPPREHIRN